MTQITVLTDEQRRQKEAIASAQAAAIEDTAVALAESAVEEPFTEGSFRGNLKLCCKHCPFDRVIRKGESKEDLQAELWRHYASFHVEYKPRRVVTSNLVDSEGNNLRGTELA